MDLVDEASELQRRLENAGVLARLLGGTAIALRCPSVRRHRVLRREYADIDVAIRRVPPETIGRIAAELGYVPAAHFNALHGRTRLMFERDASCHIDVFIDEFVMCHRLNLSDRLDLDDATLTPADLLLTKLQVAEVNQKDITDVMALLLDFATGTDERTTIAEGRVAGVLAGDWGWWRTVTENFEKVAEAARTINVNDDERTQVLQRLSTLQQAVARRRKSRRWRLRAKVGERVPWRELPEESVA